MSTTEALRPQTCPPTKGPPFNWVHPHPICDIESYWSRANFDPGVIQQIQYVRLYICLLLVISARVAKNAQKWKMSLDPNLRNKNVLIFTRISSLLTRILFNEGQRACPLKLNNFLNHKWSDNQYFSLENEGIHLSEGQGACVPQEPVKNFFF